MGPEKQETGAGPTRQPAGGFPRGSEKSQSDGILSEKAFTHSVAPSFRSLSLWPFGLFAVSLAIYQFPYSGSGVGRVYQEYETDASTPTNE